MAKPKAVISKKEVSAKIKESMKAEVSAFKIRATDPSKDQRLAHRQFIAGLRAALAIVKAEPAL